jgi:hypothetical protein
MTHCSLQYNFKKKFKMSCYYQTIIVLITPNNSQYFTSSVCGNNECASQDNESVAPLFGRLGGVITSGYRHETACKRKRESHAVCVCVCVCVFTLIFSTLSFFFPCHPSLQLQFYFFYQLLYTTNHPNSIYLSSPLLFNSSPPSLPSLPL